MSDDEINRMMEDYIIYSIERDHKKAKKRVKRRLKEWLTEDFIKMATELSETGIPTLESVKAVIKKKEDEHEEFMKSLKGGSFAFPLLLYFVISIGLAFLATFFINMVASGITRSFWTIFFAALAISMFGCAVLWYFCHYEL